MGTPTAPRPQPYNGTTHSKTATGSVTGWNHSFLICESCRSCSAREQELEAEVGIGSRSTWGPTEIGWILDLENLGLNTTRENDGMYSLWVLIELIIESLVDS